MKLPIYQVDAFADKIFEGNPAAICPLESWLDDAILQAIASENNLSETAFFVANGDAFDLRWFTPAAEVKLCGHATLASAAVLFDKLSYAKNTIIFNTLSGALSVARSQDGLVLDFPAQVPRPCPVPEAAIRAFGQKPLTSLFYADLILVYGSEDFVRNAQPDMSELKTIETRGVIITSTAKDYDIVARFFAPKLDIAEDPVTGSAFTQLVPYWAGELGKTSLVAKQVSQRGGKLTCELKGDRVLMTGHAVHYMQGEIQI